MFGKILIIAASFFSVAHAEEDEFEPFFLRMLSGNSTVSNTTATNITDVTPAPTTAAPTTAAPTTQAATTTEAVVTTTAAPTTEATTKAELVTEDVTINAVMSWPLPDGVTPADFAAQMFANENVKAVMAGVVASQLCAGVPGCAVTVESIKVAARRLEEAARQLAASGSVDLEVEFLVKGTVPAYAAAAKTMDQTTYSTLVAGMAAQLKANPALLTSLGLTAEDLDNHLVAKSVSITDESGNVSTPSTTTTTTTTVATTTEATTTGATTTAAVTTTSGAFEQSAFLAVSMVLFSRLMF